MNRLAILGASGHGKVVADAAELAGWNSCVFFDDCWPEKTVNGHWEVVGRTSDLLDTASKYDGVVVAIGDNRIRREKLHLLLQCDAVLTTIVHPSATISRYADIEPAVVVFANAIVNCDARVGMGAILNTACSVDHDCFLAECVHISPGASLAGNVTVGEASWVGIGASVKQGVVIGERVTIGAGAVVIGNVAHDSCIAGVPARELIRTRNA